MEPIRVLQVVGRMDRGGIETLIMNIYRNIDRNKVQFDFLTHYGREADYNEEIRSLGGKIYDMPKIKSTRKTYYHKFFEYVIALNDFFKKHNEYNVLHGHMTNTATIYMPIAKKYGIKNCIAHSHLTQARHGLTGIVTNILQMPLEYLATDYFSCSEMAAEWLFSKKAVEKGKVSILKNAIDSMQYAYNSETRINYRKCLNIENKFTLGHVGRFFHQKNHEFLIDIMYEVVKLEPNAMLLLVGDGELRKSCEDKVNQLNLTHNVQFLGVRSDVNNIMQAMDVFVMPSHFEGLPVVGIEAQASGLKCVFSEGITREVDITGLVDFLNLSDGPQKWAEKILLYKDQCNRKNVRELIQKSGYDISVTSKWIQEFYMEKDAVGNN